MRTLYEGFELLAVLTEEKMEPEYSTGKLTMKLFTESVI